MDCRGTAFADPRGSFFRDSPSPHEFLCHEGDPTCAYSIPICPSVIGFMCPPPVIFYFVNHIVTGYIYIITINNSYSNEIYLPKTHFIGVIS